MKKISITIVAFLLALTSFSSRAEQVIELRVNSDSNALELKAMETLISYLESSDNYSLAENGIKPSIKVNFILINIKKDDEIAAISISVLATRKVENSNDEIVEFNSRVIDVEKLEKHLISIISKVLV